MSASEVIVAEAVTPAEMLKMAVAQGADLDRLQKLMDLQERWEANQSRKAYAAAMGAFKSNPPQLVKNKHVRFQTSRGVTEYDHATHDEVTDKIGAALAQHGLSHRWNVEQGDGLIRVTCIVTHVLGHSESVMMSSAPDDSGGKNSIQAIASAVTYLQRYTLLAATGLSTSELPDDDGQGSEQKEPETPKPEGYDNWWADLMAAADEGPQQLERGWSGAPKGCRGWTAKYQPAAWETLKQVAAQVKS